ncbi:putative lipase/esterase [Aspergillus clavatus NRRL 1]|uniref:Lipase/esterase, putative n=1 Tax=Aspergillus clavatus (strain ATCC 1007 / CBS 513.65 / DSM 816 / NCTC 3887 / NRRL 1 / QM 1276 / 107) TaxID=344612 RepID=A1CEN2_ASPCL|nr:lipase/esterase, putative [Aspergillus clavatus NRRL 1]EAW11331.1 lipase/esterase, putative [Aspergillus clavatus NRRL 1]
MRDHIGWIRTKHHPELIIPQMTASGLPGAKSHVPPQLTLLQRLRLFTRSLLTLPRLLFCIARDLLLQRDPAPFRIICMRNTARLSTSLSLDQARARLRPTGCTILNLCKANDLQHEAVEIDAGADYPPAALHFIDCAPSTPGNVLLYLHGGGYIYPLNAGHFKFARLAAQRAAAKCMLLEYTLAPALAYPGQLAQAAAALRYLLERHDAAQITLAGDSAGGNLVLAVLAHMRRPHPLVRPVFEEEEERRRLRAALCISPRCANECSAASYGYNAAKDIVSAASMVVFNSNWRPVKEEVWATPLAGGKEFWQDVYAKKILVLAGTDEVYVDDIQQFAGLLGSSSQVDSKLVMCTGEIHTQAILDIAANDWDGTMLRVALNWLQNLGETP